MYGVAVRGGDVLLVCKTRGPYAGLLDLPGGRAEPGETDDAVLVREFREEVGCGVRRVGDWRPFAVTVTYERDGEETRFAHEGVWAEVELDGVPDLARRAEDVDGAAFVPIADAVAGRGVSAAVKTVMPSRR